MMMNSSDYPENWSRMPNYILPALQALADGSEHTSSGIRSFVKTKFTISPEEFTQKQKNGCTRFVNHVAWALASLKHQRRTQWTYPSGHACAERSL